MLGFACRGSLTALLRGRSVFRSAFGLNLLGVEDAVRSIRALYERLGVVLKGIWRRFDAAIGDLQLQTLLVKLEVRAGSLPMNTAWHNLPRDSQPLSMRVRAHALQFFDGDVVTFALLNASER